MTTALLVMDVQKGIVGRFASDAGPMLAAVGQAARAARSAGIPVIYVRVAFRAGAPEISSRNRSFAAAAAAGAGRFGPDDPATEIEDAVAPEPDDLLVTKKRVSAFTGSDLEVLLRGLEARSLVLTGIATSGVVLSTLRQAADLDYELTVLRDGCLDADPEVHRVLMDAVFPRQAAVTTTEAWVASLPAPRS